MLGDMHPPKPKKGINKSDGPGTYRKYKCGNYAPTRKSDDANSAVAEADSLVAAVKSAVAEAGAAASSSNAIGSPTVAAPTELDPQVTKFFDQMASLGKTGDVEKKRSKEVPAQYEQPVVSDSYYSVARGSDVPQENHSASPPGWSAQSVGTDAGSEQTHGYGVPSAIGATSSQQHIEHPVNNPLAPHEVRKLNRDNVDEEDEPTSPWILIDNTDGGSSDAAADTGPKPLNNTPDHDVMRRPAPKEAAVAATAYATKWKRTGRSSWQKNE
jgi:hypothetical protein